MSAYAQSGLLNKTYAFLFLCYSHIYSSFKSSKPYGTFSGVYASWKQIYTMEARISFMPCLQETSGLRLHHTNSTLLRSLRIQSCWKNYSYWYVRYTSFRISSFKNPSSFYIYSLLLLLLWGLLLLLSSMDSSTLGFIFSRETLHC